MKVSQIMSVNPVCVTLDDHMSVVKEIFDNAKFHHVLVIEEGKLFGVISDRDLLKVISPNLNTSRISLSDLKTLDIPVHRVVTRAPITLKPDASVSDAVKIFTTHRISCIPVVDDEGAAVGIISWRDILRHMDHVCADWPHA